MGPGVKLMLCIVLCCYLYLGHVTAGREKRQISQAVIGAYLKQALVEANQELAQMKAIDKMMVDQGIDAPAGSRSYSWHLGRFLYTKDAKKVRILSDKAWVTVRTTKKLVERTGWTLAEVQVNPYIVNEWRLQVAASCPFMEPKCNPYTRYRTADGACNNLNDPSLGAALTRQRRMMDNAYEDGIDAPRMHSVLGGYLPSPRIVSNVMHKSDCCPQFSDRLAVAVMQFGQFIEHDVISTPMITGYEGADIQCCDAPAHITAQRAACLPIAIPANDERFKDKCMNFVRAVPGLKKNCDMGIRSPLNQASAYLDSSQIYGTDTAEQHRLRAGFGGLMNITVLGLLPATSEDHCIKEMNGDYCMDSGDFRVNHVPGLTVMHTIFVREHNRLATTLSLLNVHWDDETIFQETRKIINAVQQHLVYNELLPTILNYEYMTRYGLYSKAQGCEDTYDMNVQTDIMMGFSGAAMRFPHTRIPNVQAMVDKQFRGRMDARIFDTFDKPKFILQNMGQALNDFARWLTTFPQMKDDRFVESGVRDNLFMDESGKSFDLISLNIQRAREQGIPPYNEWRKLCGLPPANYFYAGQGGLVDHKPDVVHLMSTVYKHCDDIDLFTGGLTETPLPGSPIGPVFSCIIATQFANLKQGDRFWYERDSPITGFTPAQVDQIKKTTLSLVMCKNLDFPFIQRNALLLPSQENPRVRCDSMPEIDLDFWKVPAFK
ncbi:peroxidase-like protein isoform X1 [Mytilus galloprovincialis]|uniref:peroxidase-like protein isoform X1 n=1 Tax=Mytilus galloprovincialis TaxID=29158 RepID=UPI003F7C66EC